MKVCFFLWLRNMPGVSIELSRPIDCMSSVSERVHLFLHREGINCYALQTNNIYVLYIKSPQKLTTFAIGKC